MKNWRSKKLFVLTLALVVVSGVISVPGKAQAGFTNWGYNPGDSVGIIDGKLSAIDQQLTKSDAIIQNTQNSLSVIEQEQAWKQKLLTDKLELVTQNKT